ncbi:MAG: hypothetical protein LT070_02255 [Solirubrobacteraceae bacterium]|nr:hypothetical protein [Solirubrobacteraceae bacterium]
MEAFETFVALALETEDLVVSEAQKFSFQRQTTSGLQTHGYEVDLVGARADRLVLASVKSYFGSRGVAADHLMGQSAKAELNKRYALINDEELRAAVVAAAAKRFGYSTDQVRLRLYVGRFAGSRPGEASHEQRIRDWCAAQTVGGSPIEVVDVHEVVSRVRAMAESKQYRDNAALVALKVLEAAGVLISPSAEPAGE